MKMQTIRLPSNNALRCRALAQENAALRAAAARWAKARRLALAVNGTIGAVARDAAGHVAAGTSTGGITNQMPGRVGDSPLPGCGTYAADDSVAVSCTGIGEAFVRSVAAHQIADRVRFAGQSVQEAAQAALDDVAARRGDGGVIVMPASGDGVIAYNSETMNYGYVTADGVRVVHGAE